MEKSIKLFSAQNFKEEITKTLSGCINDTKIWTKALSKLGFTINADDIFHDENKDSALSKISEFIGGLKKGDTGIIFFSGHGVRREGENIGEYKEGIVFNCRKILYDYHLRKVLNKLDEGAKLIFIVDSCHSAGLTDDKKKFILSNLYEAFTKANKSINQKIVLRYESVDPKDNEVLSFSVDQSVMKRSENTVPEKILIPKIFSTKLLQRASALRKIEKFIDDKSNEDKSIHFYNNTLTFSDFENIDNVSSISSRGIKDDSVINHDIDDEKPDQFLKKIAEYENVTYIIAEEDISQSAYEKSFGANEFHGAGIYGVFSYYATKAILENKEITYKQLKEKVNKDIGNEKNENIKEQKMNFVSGNTDWNRKLFT